MKRFRPADVAAPKTLLVPSRLMRCVSSRPPTMRKARCTSTSAPSTRSVIEFSSRMSPWRYSVFSSPMSDGLNGRRAIPMTRSTSRAWSSWRRSARPMSPVGPVIATVRPMPKRSSLSGDPRGGRCYRRSSRCRRVGLRVAIQAKAAVIAVFATPENHSDGRLPGRRHPGEDDQIGSASISVPRSQASAHQSCGSPRRSAFAWAAANVSQTHDCRRKPAMTSGDGSSCPKKRNVARGATNVADPSARSKPIMNRFCSRTRSSRPTSAAPYRTLRAVLDAAREQVASACARLAAEGLVVGTAGNVSVRVDDHIVVTPTGGVFGAMQAEEMAVVDPAGQVVDGPKGPTSELALHLLLYERMSAGAVVHTHAPYATALSCVVDEVPAVHYSMLMFGGSLKVAGYATFGTEELAQNVEQALEGRTVCLMQNHGHVGYGHDLDYAVEASLMVEWACTVYWRARALGEPAALSDEQLQDVAAQVMRLGYGQTKENEG